jgi:hypothetical protein
MLQALCIDRGEGDLSPYFLGDIESLLEAVESFIVPFLNNPPAPLGERLTSSADYRLMTISLEAIK